MAAVRRFRMKYYRLVDRSFTLLAALVFPIACVAQESSLSPIATEQEACRRFNQMRDAFQHAETLSFESKYDVEVLGVARSAFTYRVWLKKPNYFRVECRSGGGTESGVIIGDGSTMWTYWPNGRPQFDFVNESAVQRADWKTSYMRKPATDASLISLAHEMPLLGAGMGFPIIDVSVFHGHVESLAKHIDGFRYLGSESIHGDDCDKIEVSILDRQRSQYYWIADLDFLPRRVLEIVRLQNEVVTREEWSQVRLNEEIADKMFSWTPPAGWQQWVLPKKNLNWPPIGSQAPEFALRSIDGKRVRLSEFRGNVVWLNFWRLGCPPCIEELPHLQSFHEELRDSGLTLIGINVTDEKRRVQKLLGSKGITYLNVIDQSPEAERVYLDVYGVGAIPMNYIVDRSGTIIDAWVGYSTDRTVNAIRKAGLSANEHPALAIDHGKRGEQPDEPDSASRGD